MTSVSVSDLKLCPRPAQIGPEFGVIFDDAVVGDGNLAGAVGVRMRIRLGRASVSRPTGVTQAG